MTDQQLVLATATGAPLIVTEAARAHLEAHPTVWPVLQEAVGRIVLTQEDRVRAFEVDLGRPLELATLLATTAIDLDTAASFALRANRAHPSRVTQEVATTWETTVVVWVRRSEPGGAFELATAFIGKLGPLEPWDPYLKPQAEFQRALEFWCRHALVHDPQVMQPVFTSTWREILRLAASPFLQ